MRFPVIVHYRLPEPILEHEIRMRAYDLFERRGKVDGHDMDDWLKAEWEITRSKEPYSLASAS